MVDMTANGNSGNGMPSSMKSLYFQCFPNSASVQNMNGITLSVDGSTLDPAVMNVANYQMADNCSTSYSCAAIASTLVANNLLRYAQYALSTTELQSEAVICGFGYTWADGTATTTPKSAVCKYPGNWLLPSTACDRTPNNII